MKVKVRTFLIFAVALLLLSLISACSQSGEGQESTGEEELTVITGRPAWAAGAPFFATELELWEKYSLKPNHIQVENSAAVAEALASGEGDVALLTAGTALTSLERGVPIKILSGAVLTDYLIFSFDENIKTVDDLKGKKIASWSPVAEATVMFENVVKEKGWEQNKDYELVNVKAPDMTTAVQKGDADAGIVYDPYGTVALGMGAHRVGEPGTLSLRPPDWPPTTIVVVTDEALKNKPKAVKQFIDLHQEVYQYIESNTDHAYEILSGLTDQPEEEIKSSYENIELTTDLDVEYLSILADALYEAEILQNEIDVNNFVADVK